jgi:hypothetical protein
VTPHPEPDPTEDRRAGNGRIETRRTETRPIGDHRTGDPRAEDARVDGRRVEDPNTEYAESAVLRTTEPQGGIRREPERIIPASPFSVIFQSPDLATEDDDPAPSAATERAQQRRPSRPRPRRSG